MSQQNANEITISAEDARENPAHLLSYVDQHRSFGVTWGRIAQNLGWSRQWFYVKLEEAKKKGATSDNAPLIVLDKPTSGSYPHDTEPGLPDAVGNG